MINIWDYVCEACLAVMVGGDADQDELVEVTRVATAWLLPPFAQGPINLVASIDQAVLDEIQVMLQPDCQFLEGLGWGHIPAGFVPSDLAMEALVI